MAAYLRPRRGTASGSTVVLKEGEIFLDTAKSGNATTLSSWGQIYVGNNTNNISALKPFVSLPESMVVNSGISSTGSNSDIANGKNLATMFSAIKKLLSDHATSITNLNNDMDDVNTELGLPDGTIPGNGQVAKYLAANVISNGLKVSKYSNQGTFTFTFASAPSAAYFGTLIVMNSNQGVLGGVGFGTGTVYRKWDSGNVTCSPTWNGKTLTLTFNATLWGLTVIIWGTN